MDMEKIELDTSTSTIKFGRTSYGLKHYVILLVAAGVGLAIGLLVGKFVICGDPDVSTVYVSSDHKMFQEKEEDLTVGQLIMDSIDPMNIKENLRILSSKPHIAGRKNDFELVSLIQKHFRDHGLHVQTTPYDVLLSYPSNTTRNSVRILNETGEVIYDAVNDESEISRLPDVVPPFHAFAAPGLVEGDVVFANYGRHVDYEMLQRLGVNVTGKIVLVKYGKLFRGSKVAIAQFYGASGVIIYSDPADHTGAKYGDSRVYPDAWWLPPTGAQRGTLSLGKGDPLTPGYPSNNLAYRCNESQADPPLPKIPSHPMGYGAAYNILKYMAGPEAPSNWSGGLNITYRLGPGFTLSGIKLQLNVTNQNQRAKVENVFGIIKGGVEPDRYVMMGNHRDAWIYGAIDPSSGTAVMMEVSRVLGDLVKSGRWKPRRSIVFCSWGAEEFGLIGSSEWVEQYVATLRERVVSYINLDTAVIGNQTLRVAANPLFHSVVFDATKKVLNPNPTEVQAGRRTVYDTWLNVTPYSDDLFGKQPVPLISAIASGSDYAALIQFAGVTSVDVRYAYNKKVYDISNQPLYHTEYETFEAVQHYSKDFQMHAAVARVDGEMLRSLADSVILPFRVSDYAKGVERLRRSLHAEYGQQLKQMVDNYDLLADVIKNFTSDAIEFESKILTLDKTDPYAVRSINDRIMLLEKAFLNPEGLPLRPMKKHIIFAENSNDVYSPTSFPGLNDLMFQIEKHPDRWEKVRRHFSALLHTIQSAGATLRDVTNFMSETL